jgi:predicted MFS family arabinose efflux permease
MPDQRDSHRGGSHRTELSVPALMTVNLVLIVGTLSTGIFPLLVDGLERLVHLGEQEAGLCVTAELLGQAAGAAAVLALQRRISNRYLCIASLSLIAVGNALSMGVIDRLPILLLMRAVAGIGCGLTGICIGLFAQTKHPDRNFAIFTSATVIACALLAAAAPLIYRSFGIIGLFAAIAASAAFCLLLVPFIPSHSARANAPENAVSHSTASLRTIVLTCVMCGAYFTGTMMFWSYAGQIGAWHHLDVTAVSSNVAAAWLVGGLAGSMLAVPTARHLSRTITVVVCAIGSALTAYGSVVVDSAGGYSAVLYGFVFLWLLSFPIQMGIFSEVDPSGRIAILAFVVQLIAFAMGPFLGGFILRSDSYITFGLCCGLGYLIFIGAAFMLLPTINKTVQRTAELS